MMSYSEEAMYMYRDCNSMDQLHSMYAYVDLDFTFLWSTFSVAFGTRRE